MTTASIIFNPLIERTTSRGLGKSSAGEACGWTLDKGSMRPVAMLQLPNRKERHRLAAFDFQRWEFELEDVSGVVAGQELSIELVVSSGRLMPIRGTVVSSKSNRLVFIPQRLTYQQAVSAFLLLSPQLKRRARPIELGEPPKPRKHLIDDEDRVRTILRAFANSQAEAFVDGCERPLKLRLRACDEGVMSWDVLQHTDAICSPFVINIAGPLGFYSFRSLISERSTSQLRTTVPTQLERCRARSHVRTRMHGELAIRFKHPIWGFSIEREVEDVSAEGLSFRSVPVEDLLVPGSVLDVELIVNGTVLHLLDIVVVRTNTTLPTEVNTCGALLEPNSMGLWKQFVTRYTHPNVLLGNHTSEAVWDVYVRSGYLNISAKSPEEFATLRHSFDRCHDALNAHPALGARLLWRDASGASVATYSMVRAYSRSMFALQLAKVPGKQFDGVRDIDVLRELLSHEVEYALASEDVRYRITYAAPGVKFSKLFTHQFANSVGLADYSDIRSMNCYEVPILAQRAQVIQSKVVLTPPKELLLWLRRNRPFIYRDAYDLDSRSNFSATERAWGDAGLHRTRFFLVQKSELGTCVAMADVAEAGMHLYDFLNSARIFVLSGTPLPQVQDLVEDLKTFYVGMGKERFIYFDEMMMESELVADLGGKLLGTSVATILDMEILPDQTDYLFEMLAAPEPVT
jgi:hypothetical protein